MHLPNVGKIYMYTVFIFEDNLSWDTFKGNIIIKPHVQMEDPHVDQYIFCILHLLLHWDM